MPLLSITRICLPMRPAFAGDHSSSYRSRTAQLHLPHWSQPMAFKKISLEVCDGIACITFRNSEKLNAWDGQMLNELKSAMASVARDDTARVVILTGEGRAFSVGADLNW